MVLLSCITGIPFRHSFVPVGGPSVSNGFVTDRLPVNHKDPEFQAIVPDDGGPQAVRH
jgi:hypothetical protein